MFKVFRIWNSCISIDRTTIKMSDVFDASQSRFNRIVEQDIFRFGEKGEGKKTKVIMLKMVEIRASKNNIIITYYNMYYIQHVLHIITCMYFTDCKITAPIEANVPQIFWSVLFFSDLN